MQSTEAMSFASTSEFFCHVFIVILCHQFEESRIHNFGYFVSMKNDFNVSSTSVIVPAKYVSNSHMMLIRDQGI